MSVVFTGGSDFRAAITHVGMYSDGTPLVKDGQWNDIVRNASTMVLQADSLDEFVVGMFLADSVRDAGGEINRLVLPYLPGARQDRSNPTGDVLFTAKSVADMVNRRGFKRVISVDPHSKVMPALIENFVEFPLENVYKKLWQGYGGVIAPDKGAIGRAMAAWRVIGGELRYGSKVRDVATGKLTGFECEELTPGKHYIVVDDICDGGGTFIGLGEKIREQGAFADLFVTHGIFSHGTRELKETFKSIYTTNTRVVTSSRRTDVMQFDIVTEMESF